MMFVRPDISYKLDKRVVVNILKDKASPLKYIVDSIPDGSVVLDIGAGNGLLSELLNFNNKSIVIDGIEPNNSVSVENKKKYRKYYKGYLQDFMEQLLVNDYDFIVVADVLEHVYDPIDFLSSVRRLMKENTQLLLSVPNIAFGAVRLSLLEGKFEYVDSGLLERTHIRFFTLKTLIEVFSLTNLHIAKRIDLKRSFSKVEIKVNWFILFLLKSFLKKDPTASVYQFFFLLRTQDIPIK